MSQLKSQVVFLILTHDNQSIAQLYIGITVFKFNPMVVQEVHNNASAVNYRRVTTQNYFHLFRYLLCEMTGLPVFKNVSQSC